MKLFWICYEIALLICEALFCIRLQAAWNGYKRLKKEYCLAPVELKKGHAGRARAEVELDLVNKKVELVSWACIAFACVYALIDCFTRITG